MPSHVQLRQVSLIGLLVSAAACGRHRAATDAYVAAPLLPSISAVVPVAPGQVVGRVVDAHSGAALEQVDADIRDLARRARSDTAGWFQFDSLPPGTLQVRLRRIGYQTVTVAVDLRVGAGASLFAQLQRTPVHLVR